MHMLDFRLALLVPERRSTCTSATSDIRALFARLRPTTRPSTTLLSRSADHDVAVILAVPVLFETRMTAALRPESSGTVSGTFCESRTGLKSSVDL